MSPQTSVVAWGAVSVNTSSVQSGISLEHCCFGSLVPCEQPLEIGSSLVDCVASPTHLSHLPDYLALLSCRLSNLREHHGDVNQMEHATCTCTSITLGCLKGCKINSEYPIHSLYCYCTALYYITVLILCTHVYAQ